MCHDMLCIHRIDNSVLTIWEFSRHCFFSTLFYANANTTGVMQKPPNRQVVFF